VLVAAAVAAGWAAEFRAEGSFERTLQVSGPAELEIRTSSGRIEVRRGEAGVVRIRGLMRAGEWFGEAEEEIRRLEADPPIDQSDNLIRIGRRPSSGQRSRVQISYEVTAPAGSRVRAESGSGRISIDGLAGAAYAHSGSGRIEIAGLKGSLRAHTGSGRISVEGEAAGNWNVHTGSGSVHLRLPSQAGFELRARTGSGRITCDHPLTVRGSIDRRSLTGLVRNGGPLLEVTTGSGSIQVE
jgi:DUF4097 and DUF4098 domain-containing protein YvlB